MIIALTGGIATGKSSLSNILKEKKYKVVDADLIARDLANKSTILKELSKAFGKDIVDNKQLNRAYLREIVFNDEKKLNILNNIMHPEIIKKIKEEIEENKNKKILFLDIPLLFETKLEYLANKILLVTCDEEIQINRLMKRDNINLDLALNMINKQMALKEKENLSDYIIYNNSTLEELEDKIDIFLEKFCLSL